MSLIEDAVRKLQRRRLPALVTAKRLPGAHSASAVPIAGKKKVVIDGPKHHVPLDALVGAGLLAPRGHEVSVADEFRRIKRPLIVNALQPPNKELPAYMNVIMIASALPGAGKTFCAVNLALSVALERELNVLLVDADVAKPQISREFGLAQAPGLIDLLLDESLEFSSTLVRTDLNDIQVLPAGRSHPQATELLASERMARTVRELSLRYHDRIIILDSPPLLVMSEAQALAGQVGQIALIVEAGETSRQVLTQAIAALDPDKAINLILNKRRHGSSAGYYDGQHRHYGHEEA